MLSDKHRKTLTEITAALNALLAEDGSTDSDIELSVRLRTAAGWHPQPELLKVAPIRALLKEGFDLQEDILPVIAAKGPKVKERGNWAYFVEAIREHRAKRLAPPPITIDARGFPTQWSAWLSYFERTGQTNRIAHMQTMGYYTVSGEFPPKETPAGEAGANSGGGSKTAAPDTSVALT